MCPEAGGFGEPLCFVLPGTGKRRCRLKNETCPILPHRPTEMFRIAAERAVPCQNENAVVVASAQEIAAEKAEQSATGDSTCAPVEDGCGQDPHAGKSSSGTRDRGSGALEVCKSGAIVQKLEPEERSRADTRMLQFAVVDASKPDPLL